MAISYVGGQSGSVAGSAANSARGARVAYALTGGSDSTPQAGDVVVLSLAVAATTLPTRFDIGDGFHTVADVQTGVVTNKVRLLVGLHVVREGGETNFRYPPTGSSANPLAWAIEVWRGVDVTTLDVAATTASGTATGQPNPGSITPATAGAVIITAGAAAAAAGATFTSSDLTDFRTAARADTYDAMIGMGYKVWTSGAFDPAAFGGGTTGASDSWVAVTMALRPGIAAGSQIVVDEGASTGFTFSTVNIDGTNYRLAVATDDATLSVTTGGDVQGLPVAGGASGAMGRGGGGGGGGVEPFSAPIPAGTYSVTIGLGGAAPTAAGPGNDGTDTVFGLIRASGGGAGMNQVSNGATYGHDGGSGGGGSGGDGTTTTTNAGGLSSGEQGNNGGAGNMSATGNDRAGGGGGGWGGAGGDAATGVGGAAGEGGATTIRGSTEYFSPGGPGASTTGWGSGPTNGAGQPGAGGKGGHTTGTNDPTGGLNGTIILRYLAPAGTNYDRTAQSDGVSTLSAARTVSLARSAAISSASALSAAATITRGRAASVASASTLSCARTITRGRAASITATSTLSATASVSSGSNRTASITATSTLTATARCTRPRAASIAAASTLTASATVTSGANRTASITATSALSAQRSVTSRRSAAVASASSLLASRSVTSRRAAAIAAASALSATASTSSTPPSARRSAYPGDAATSGRILSQVRGGALVTPGRRGGNIV